MKEEEETHPKTKKKKKKKLRIHTQVSFVVMCFCMLSCYSLNGCRPVSFIHLDYCIGFLCCILVVFRFFFYLLLLPFLFYKCMFLNELEYVCAFQIFIYFFFLIWRRCCLYNCKLCMLVHSHHKITS